MELTTGQLQSLKTAIEAIPDVGTLNEHQIAAVLNAEVSPAYFVWRTAMHKHELTQENGIDADGSTATAFVWGGATGGYIGRTQGERDAFKELFNSTLTCNPSLPNVRTAFGDIFSGAGAGAVANRAHCSAKGRRKCTVGEKVFVTQTVGGPTQTGNRGVATNPDTLGPEGLVTSQNVVDALNQP